MVRRNIHPEFGPGAHRVGPGARRGRTRSGPVSYLLNRSRQDIFPHLPAENRPGITIFTATCWGELLEPKLMPAGEQPPAPADCYRFILSNPDVNVRVIGPSNAEQMEQNLRALQAGPLDEEEMARMQRIGKGISGYRKHKSRFATIPVYFFRQAEMKTSGVSIRGSVDNLRRSVAEFGTTATEKSWAAPDIGPKAPLSREKRSPAAIGMLIAKSRMFRGKGSP